MSDSRGTGITVEERSATFDAVAEDYDREFTHTLLGRELRARVWQRLAARFPVGSRVLELNCGPARMRPGSLRTEWRSLPLTRHQPCLP